MDELNMCECCGVPEMTSKKITLKVEKLSQPYVCDAVEDVLKFSQVDGVNGINNLVIDRCKEEVRMEYNPNLVNLDYIKETINQLGYKVEIRK